MKRRVAILGSTGSIGTNALNVAGRLKSDFEVAALSADSNIKLLSEQCRAFHPKVICAGNSQLAGLVKGEVSSKTKVLYGGSGLEEIVSRPDIDIVLFAISGSACLGPLIKAIENKKRIALANKEAIVSAGEIVMDLAVKSGVDIIPVDSEHSAIFQCLDGKREYLRKIYLTGSGGPLLNVPKSKFDKLPKKSILKHPKWKMGKKITVDSATMMNKALEVIEASRLFNISEKFIEVLVHPEAIVHSMVEFNDGALLAQLGMPDMRLPIQYALTYPARVESPVSRVDFHKEGNLTFERPDLRKFPCLDLARRALKNGGTHPAVLNAADEEAVRFYLDGKIKFSSIPEIIEKVLARHRGGIKKRMTLGDVLSAERWAKEEVKLLCL